MATNIAISAKLEKRRYSITRLKLDTRRLPHTWLCTWKEKILDYEIETRATDTLTMLLISLLEKRRYSITRLKQEYVPRTIYNEACNLEKRRYSITRLKPQRVSSMCWGSVSLKREDTRLRDWNKAVYGKFWVTLMILEKRRYSITRLKLKAFVTHHYHRDSLKREDTRLRDWNLTTRNYRITRFTPLKREDTRLRDWNLRCYHTFQSWLVLEKRRYSITRLKHDWRRDCPHRRHRLEKRRYSITRLKPLLCRNYRRRRWNLKREDTRLRDWNDCRKTFHICAWFLPWKEKILDYEIETDTTRFVSSSTISALKREDTRLRDWNYDTHGGLPGADGLEKRRYSITRLKLLVFIMMLLFFGFYLKREDTRLRDWNIGAPLGIVHASDLEKRRYSITRLKRGRDHNLRWRISTWKEKILDYEIETPTRQRPIENLSTWKEKILDYEIETQGLVEQTGTWTRLWLEKRRYSITRLKRPAITQVGNIASRLKREDTRLRDWNVKPHDQPGIGTAVFLEIRRNSITRLKRGERDQQPVGCRRRTLKSEKKLDYEIETLGVTRTCSPYESVPLEIREETRLRDWNPMVDYSHNGVCTLLLSLKSEKKLDYEIET